MNPTHHAALLSSLPPKTSSSARKPPSSWHTFYGGARLLKADTFAKLEGIARRTFATYASTPRELATALGVPHAPVLDAAHTWIDGRLSGDCIRDYRVDFEDGLGSAAPDEVVTLANQAGAVLGRIWKTGNAPAHFGMRPRELVRSSAESVLSTVGGFWRAFRTEATEALPEGAVVTLPKVEDEEQVRALVGVLDHLERELRVPAGWFSVELLVETPRPFADTRRMRSLVEAAGARCAGLHFGAYDFTSALGIPPHLQGLSHPACDDARRTMALVAAEFGIPVSDGATHDLPVPPHRGASSPLSADQTEENRAVVWRAWRLHFDQITSACANGIFCGWDLHPAQVPARLAALYLFFHEALEVVRPRYRSILAAQGATTTTGGFFDDNASGSGIIRFVELGLAWGIYTSADIAGAS